MIRQVILSGSFFDAGVKKLDTALSEDRRPSVSSLRTGSPTYLWWWTRLYASSREAGIKMPLWHLLLSRQRDSLS